jgi:hypothetical protein
MMTMRGFMLFSLFCLVAFAGWAQHSNKELLTMKAWKIQSDEMSGLGVHTSLQRDTELQFFADGTWKSSQPINEASSGTWRLENRDRNLVMKSGAEETSYLIRKLTEKELHYRIKRNAATYTYQWVSTD